MVSKQRVTQYHIARLKDKRSAVRLDAIHELLLLEAFDALDALKDVFETDSEEEVRKAAQQAGRLIFLKHKSSTESSS